jgi:hypothetical protein
MRKNRTWIFFIAGLVWGGFLASLVAVHLNVDGGCFEAYKALLLLCAVLVMFFGILLPLAANTKPDA